MAHPPGLGLPDFPLLHLLYINVDVLYGLDEDLLCGRHITSPDCSSWELCRPKPTTGPEMAVPLPRRLVDVSNTSAGILSSAVMFTVDFFLSIALRTLALAHASKFVLLHADLMDVLSPSSYAASLLQHTLTAFLYVASMHLCHPTYPKCNCHHLSY